MLVELPAECEPLLEWVGHDELVPPVAMLGHATAGSAFLPFAVFSPEWQAALWARRRGVTLRAIDLPLATSLVVDRGGDPHEAVDPLAALAAAAGDDDAERWWDDVVEHRGDGLPAFDAVAEAMRAARLDLVPRDADTAGSLTLVREAHMRTVLRAVLAEGHRSVAVVCGAWHVPALEQPWPSAADDRRLVKAAGAAASAAGASTGSRRVAVSWVPWTHRRLLAAGGYGAGVRSPGWYAHVFEHPGADGVSRWFVDAARLVRARGMSASPDHLIAATRVADALAALRGRPRAGLDEVRDAADAVMHGALAFIDRELVIGDAIGSVPADAPQVPLAVDLAAQQRAVRLPPASDVRRVELDLRTPNGRARSLLLHRLRALEVPWGTLVDSRSSTGTFRETWEVRWEPELAIRVVERSAYGLTVAAAASAMLCERGATGTSLPDMVRLLDRALLADLPDAVRHLAAGVEQRAARDPDVLELFDALEPLAQALRYGDVRGTDQHALRSVFDGMVVRVLAGAVVACRSLDDDAAAAMTARLAAVQAAVSLVDHPARRGEWPAVLTILADRPDVHGLVQGRAVRLLHDGGAWPPRRVGHRLSRALSRGAPTAAGAAFVEGLLAGSAALLVHERVLLDEIDEWISSLAADAFDEVVPLLRRTFGAFEAPERRQIGRLLASAGDAQVVALLDGGLDEARAAAGIDTVRTMFGVPR